MRVAGAGWVQSRLKAPWCLDVGGSGAAVESLDVTRQAEAAPESSSNQGMLRIGAVAKRAELSIRTIRHYDDLGLVRPSGRSEGGFRLYTHHDVGRLLLIRRMKPLGFSLDEMADLLAIVEAHDSAPTDQTAAAVAEFVRVAQSRRDDLVAKLAAADEFISQLRRIDSE